MVLTENDKYIIKLKQLSWTNSQIARKLGITESQVDERWKFIQNSLISAHESGYAAFLDVFTNACHQYQLLGESLKILAGVVGNRLTESELSSLITEDRAETIKNLTSHCLVLHPFVPITAEESIKKTLGEN